MPWQTEPSPLNPHPHPNPSPSHPSRPELALALTLTLTLTLNLTLSLTLTRYDDGVLMDREGWFSVTPEVLPNPNPIPSPSPNPNRSPWPLAAGAGYPPRGPLLTLTLAKALTLTRCWRPTSLPVAAATSSSMPSPVKPSP